MITETEYRQLLRSCFDSAGVSALSAKLAPPWGLAWSRIFDTVRSPGERLTVAGRYAFVKIRYKLPRSDRSVLISTPVDRGSEHGRFEDAPLDARFATSVAAFGEISVAKSTPASSL